MRGYCAKPMDPIFTGRLDYISDANKVKAKGKRYAYSDPKSSKELQHVRRALVFES